MDISTRRLSVPGKPGFKATGLTQKSQVILLLAIATHFNCQKLTEFYTDESTKRRVADYRVIMLKVILVMFCNVLESL